MELSRPHRARLAVLVVAGAAALASCSGQIGPEAPTTTKEPLSAAEMCDLGQDVFLDIDELDRPLPDSPPEKVEEYLGKVKEAIERLGSRPPAEIRDDIQAYVEYAQAVTDVAQLGGLPDDLRVSTGRIDEWWRANCGRPLINQ